MPLLANDRVANENSLLIRHARILLPEGEWLTGDVLIRDERIVEIAEHIDNPNDLT